MKNNYIKNIFNLWLVNLSSNISQEAVKALKKVILISFHSLYYYKDIKDARNRFFKLYTDLYMVISFNSTC